jgi:N6-adenosine-specific RNA methylase IME4
VRPFTSILADPPWQYGDRLPPTEAGGERGAAGQYHVMTTDAICALAQPGEIAGFPIADHAVLYCWVTNSFLLNGDGARVCKAWGFEPKQLITWVKGRLVIIPCPDASGIMPSWVLNVGLGRYTRGCTEHIILATRGQATKLILEHNIPNVFMAPRTRHSAKPEAQYGMVERLTSGPYLELFARQNRAGWTSFGDQLHVV